MTACLEELFTQHGIELLGYADTAFVFARPEQPAMAVKVGIDVADGWRPGHVGAGRRSRRTCRSSTT